MQIYEIIKLISYLREKMREYFGEHFLQLKFKSESSQIGKLLYWIANNKSNGNMLNSPLPQSIVFLTIKYLHESTAAVDITPPGAEIRCE